MRIEERYGRQRPHGISTQFAGYRADRRRRGLVHRARREFFLVIPLVEAEPAFLGAGIVDMGWPDIRTGRGRMKNGRMANDLAGLAMSFEVVKGLDGEEDSIYRQDKRVKS